MTIDRYKEGSIWIEVYETSSGYFIYDEIEEESEVD